MNLVPKSTLNRLYKIVNACQYIIDNFQNADNEAYDKAAEIIKKDYDFRFYNAVTDWYDSYSRTSYDPTMSLLKSYKIEYDASTGEISLDWGGYLVPDTHRASPYYIFDLAVMQGYHGGANAGPGHPNPGSYWYHAPGIKGVWVRPAKKTYPLADKFRGLERLFQSNLTKKEIDKYYNQFSMDALNQMFKESGLLSLL